MALTVEFVLTLLVLHMCLVHRGPDRFSPHRFRYPGAAMSHTMILYVTSSNNSQRSVTLQTLWWKDTYRNVHMAATRVHQPDAKHKCAVTWEEIDRVW